QQRLFIDKVLEALSRTASRCASYLEDIRKVRIKSQEYIYGIGFHAIVVEPKVNMTAGLGEESRTENMDASMWQMSIIRQPNTEIRCIHRQERIVLTDRRMQ